MTEQRTKTIVRTADLDAPAWEQLPCGIAIKVTRHGRGNRQVRVLLRVPNEAAVSPETTEEQER